MGKYMRRKSKTSGEVSLMEVPSLGGVLTRAKTLALQKAVGAGSFSYIQLHSRRLVKPNSLKKQKEICVPTNRNKLRVVNPSNLKVESVICAVSVKNLVDKEVSEVLITSSSRYCVPKSDAKKKKIVKD
ncbi:hypothetical protein L1987_40103 [Smallanthus sonchifolius]|uniref:Uncharacterized protein n=1 Tax=Smallanthus sonchifolius TaxID=185202 RepID=A0ACB9GTS1_9ASTR|nr:hypothetical protein L1987_40103 [Smallanthus sonchifolius]